METTLFLTVLEVVFFAISVNIHWETTIQLQSNIEPTFHTAQYLQN